jgi:hypothetical protein
VWIEKVTAGKLKAGDRVKELNNVLTVVKSERHPTHARYQLLTLEYPDGDQWHRFTATREVGMVRQYDKVTND